MISNTYPAWGSHLRLRRVRKPPPIKEPYERRPGKPRKISLAGGAYYDTETGYIVPNKGEVTR